MTPWYFRVLVDSGADGIDRDNIIVVVVTHKASPLPATDIIQACCRANRKQGKEHRCCKTRNRSRSPIGCRND